MVLPFVLGDALNLAVLILPVFMITNGLNEGLLPPPVPRLRTAANAGSGVRTRMIRPMKLNGCARGGHCVGWTNPKTSAVELVEAATLCWRKPSGTVHCP